jgi:serine/threonine protein phosphatase 1
MVAVTAGQAKSRRGRVASANSMHHIKRMTMESNPRKGRRDAALPAPPSGTRVYAVGDIHGRVDLLRILNGLIHEDAYARQAPRNVVVYLGDYVDRGEDSRGVIDLLLREPLPGFERVHLKGNHEEVMIRFLEDTALGQNWLAFGGMDTLASYGVRPPVPGCSRTELERAQRELALNLPRAHFEFLRDLPLTHEEGDYFFAHAGVRPGIKLDQQEAKDLLWIREEFLQSDENLGKVVVHGHSITEEPTVRRNRIGIDTGAFRSDRLTCFIAEGTEWSFLQT